MHKTILILPGDGIGPEVTAEAVKLLRWFHQHTAPTLDLIFGEVGGAAIEAQGSPLPENTLSKAKQADSILLGAVGGPQWDALAHLHKPEKGLLKLRQELDLYANLRPVNFFEALSYSSPLKYEYLQNLDLMIVRELTGDVYFGEPRGIHEEQGEKVGVNTMRYSESEIERVARIGLTLARERQQDVCSVDKANVLETSMLWRETVQKVRDQERVFI